MSKKRARGTDTRAARRPQPNQPPPRRIPILPIVFVAVASLLVVAIVFTGGESKSDEERVAEVAGAPLISGEGLARYTDNPLDPAVGTVAPTVTGDDYAGRVVPIVHDGTPKAVMFLAHWCGHCQAEVPRVQRWLNETGGVPGVDIVSVTTSYQPAQGNWSPQDWLDDEGWTVPLIRDDADSSVYVAYGAGPFPYWVFLNGDGSVAGRAAGELGTETLEQLLRGLAGA